MADRNRRPSLINNFAQVAKDVRALGTSAPMRAAYEASKRTGLHSVLFRPTNNDFMDSEPPPFGTEVPADQHSRRRCLGDAHRIVTEGVRVFGERSRTGINDSWSTDPLTGVEWQRDVPWWEVDIRTDQRLSDVKFVWEAARHRDLVVLARAAVLDPDGEWSSHLQQALNRWCIECPPETGVNWYSSLELALRAIAWSQVLALAGDQLAASLKRQLNDQLLASARHILVELPYTVSSMKNNHLIGDGLGLVVLGAMFPTHKRSRHWKRIGDSLMLRQLRRHMRSDGSMIEDSLSYHRFVMEMLLVRHLLGDAPAAISEAMVAAAEHLVHLGVLDGPVPQFGDWDEGRVLADSAPPGSVLGSTYAALALGGVAVPPEAWQEYDELAWYVAWQDGTKPLPQMADHAGYFTIERRGDYTLWLKTGGGPSHQHADITSLWVRRGSIWLVEDPGTGTYNGPLIVRNGFRTSQAHPVWRPDGQDQLQPHRAFRWLNTVNSSAARLDLDHATVLIAVHDAFLAANPYSRVARLVVATTKGIEVADFAENASGPWRMNIPLGATAHQDEFYGLETAELVCGSQEPFLGWSSPTYGSWKARPWISLTSSMAPSFGWGVGVKALALDPEVEWLPGMLRVEVTVQGRKHSIEVHHGE